MGKNNLTFKIGERIGKLEEAQKSTTARLGSVEFAVGGLAKEVHEFQGVLENVRNPKISVRDIARALVKGAAYAGGGGGTFLVIYAFFQEVLKWFFR
jgi:hypothetical protein